MDEARKYLYGTAAGRRAGTPAFPPRRTAQDLPVPPGAYRVSASEGIVGPEVLEKHMPEYSDEARVAGLEGMVFLTGVIDENGIPGAMQVTAPLGLGLDEKALQAVQGLRFRPGTRNGNAVPTFVTISIDFVLPSKQSRWHLIRVGFDEPVGVSRPVFLRSVYPLGVGVSRPATEEASLVAAAKRQATTTLSFNVDQHGDPIHFQVDATSGDQWGPEAIAIVREWKFTPAMKNGETVSVPCVVTLVWGERNIAANVFYQLSDLLAQ